MSYKYSPSASTNGRNVNVPGILVRAPTIEHDRQPTENLEGYYSELTLSKPSDVVSHTTTESLEDRLWEVAVAHAQGPTKKFWPPPLWKSLVTQDSIVDELVELDDNISREKALAFGKKILDSGSNRRVLVFTVLLFLRKLDCLDHMLHHCKHGGLRDNDLPLALKTTNGGKQGLFHRQSGHHKSGRVADCCLRKWSMVQLEAFNDFQRRLMPPVFGLKEIDNTIVELQLDDEAILPWCEVQDNLVPVVAMSGGFGTVSRVKIHPMCHRFDKTLEAINVAGGLFAVKKLKQKDRKEFQKEVDALSRFSGKVHKNLVTLLATFTQHGYYHMIFPWAEYDLDTYWDSHPEPNLADVGLARWVLKQCMGIMDAINLVHNPTHLASGTQFGRHGDIKAENILWYKTNKSHGRGIFVISDFGLAALNSAKSRSMMPNDYVGLKVTPSYRPPECDTLGGKITRAFDIWSLGCLYLELVCWLLRGTRGKREFDVARTTPFIFGTKVDIYFDIKRSESDYTKYVFSVKEVVSKTISELHGDFKCTPWIHALLDLIEQNMLLVISSKSERKGAKYLLGKLREMDTKASDPDYCVSRKPENRLARYTKPPGVLSELCEAAQRHMMETQPRIETYKADGRILHHSLRAVEWDNPDRQ